MALLLGSIADDLTGATDLALMLAKNGLRTVQTIGVPPPDLAFPPADAIVVALKSRTIPAAEAVKQSLAAADRLVTEGARQLFFKYCSTFDSTDAGNIGPVAEALLERMNTDLTIACPAFPANARTIYQGHLFVGDVLLSDSSMRHHPLTPMTDANLVRVLGRQCRKPDSVGLIAWPEVAKGPESIRAAFDRLRSQGRRIAIVDALTDADLMAIGEACRDFRLLTGGSGVAMGLPRNFRRAGLLSDAMGMAPLPRLPGKAAVLSGSCSAMTQAQVKAMALMHPTLILDPAALAHGEQTAALALAWATPRLNDGPVLIASTAAPEEVARAQAHLGRDRAAQLIEHAFAEIARGLAAAGVRKLVVAGGETSGAVVTALGVRALAIGPEIAPGVPWTLSLDEPRLALALKSGNFGAEHFFIQALEMLP